MVRDALSYGNSVYIYLPAHLFLQVPVILDGVLLVRLRPAAILQYRLHHVEALGTRVAERRLLDIVQPDAGFVATQILVHVLILHVHLRR